METFTKLIKVITDFFGFSNALLQIPGSIKKSKSLLLSSVGILIISMAACTYFFYQDDGSNSNVFVSIYILCFVLLVLVLFITVTYLNRKRDAVIEEFQKELATLNTKHVTELEMLAEEHRSALSIQSDQHKRCLSDMTFKNSQTRKTLLQNYYRLHHDFRNAINKMEKHHKDDPKNQIEPVSVQAVQFTQNLLDYLSAIFTQLTGEPISACVKIIDLGKDSKEIDYTNACVKTFLRSKNTEQARISRDDGHPKSVKLSENTDFMEIVSDDRINLSSCFYQGDLHEYDRTLKKINLEYRNTTQNYGRFYQGTIVAPIRIGNQYIFYTDKEEGYNTIGFLCVDSKSNIAFPPEHEEEYTNIMRAFAAILYNILSKYQFYLADQVRCSQEEKTTDASNPENQAKRNRITGFLNRS